MLDLLNRMTELLDGMLGSPWLWAIVFVVSALDALLPFMPSDTSVIVVGVLVAPDPRPLIVLIVLAAAGALAGDLLGYLIGRRGGAFVLPRLTADERGRRRHEWAKAQLRRHGSMLIMVARYIPGGRVATMLSAGALHYPLRRFLIVEVIATSVWAAYCALIGYLGGATFQHNMLGGMALALGIGAVIMVLLEVGRRLWARRRPPESPAYATSRFDAPVN
ncbi:MAG TPA: DedA family protein [Actinophytocola sp.]|uniref:DedA family protein n=1 Tax=Actinophytocola sp. TaxID=1872138 RepID=UPI002DDCB736|nr:DedA family protein [Actinophytocola sp.]HEV2779978.1 DedA family protein [Actinophytocola sp.]